MTAMLKTRAFGPAKASRATSIICRAESGMQRRALLAATFGMTALMSKPALALIPDEEDEELLERAKSKRKERLAQQEQTTRDFIRQEGLKDVRLDQELVPVQKAVQQLSKSGAQLESGDVNGAASTLSGSWVAEFRAASERLSDSDSAKASASQIFASLEDLRGATSKGDATASKRAFVSVASAVASWATAAGVASELKGL